MITGRINQIWLGRQTAAPLARDRNRAPRVGDAALETPAVVQAAVRSVDVRRDSWNPTPRMPSPARDDTPCRLYPDKDDNWRAERRAASACARRPELPGAITST